MRHFALLLALLGTLAAQPPAQKKAAPLPPIVPKPEELAAIRSKLSQLDSQLSALAANKANPGLLTDVEIYAKAARFLLEFPQTFFTQDGIAQASSVLDEGLNRARQLQANQPSWTNAKGRFIHAYRSPLDGSVQPYGVTIPDSYNPAIPARLYVWLHGRDATLTEAS